MKEIVDYKPFDFQVDTINRCLNIIESCGGCFIMDLTGLGKTVTAATTAINLVDKPKILVISTNNNKIGWETVLKNTDTKYTICGSQKISDEKDFNVIIVDEAHNFRNTKSKSYRKLWSTIRLQTTKCYVILLSATPFQNNYQEFANTIGLIQFRTNTVANLLLNNYFSLMNEKQKKLDTLNRFTGGDIRLGADIIHKSFRDISNLITIEKDIERIIERIKTVLPEFCVRTTREDIKLLYPNDLALMGMFPKINIHKYEYETKKGSAIHDLVFYLTDVLEEKNDEFLTFCVYNLQQYSKTESSYIGMSGIMKSYLLKRLDSSLEAFKYTVNNTIDKYNRIIDSGYIYLDDLVNIKIDDKEHTVSQKFIGDLTSDLKILNKFLELADKADQKDKENKLVDILKQSTKSIVFTEYRSTLRQIEKILINEKITYLLIDGDSTEKELEKVQKEFDANIPIKDQTNKYQVLICTDVMAEGVNLHRANTLIHYDSKWNPQKTIQRNGRVDRIYINKQDHKEIDIYQFSVSKLVDQIIRFENKTNFKLNNALNILDFNWRNRELRLGKWEVGKKYRYPQPTQWPETYGGIITNSGYHMVTCVYKHLDFFRQNIIQEVDTEEFNRLMEIEPIEVGDIGNNSKVGIKHELKEYELYSGHIFNPHRSWGFIKAEAFLTKEIHSKLKKLMIYPMYFKLLDELCNEIFDKFHIEAKVQSYKLQLGKNKDLNLLNPEEPNYIEPNEDMKYLSKVIENIEIEPIKWFQIGCGSQWVED